MLHKMNLNLLRILQNNQSFHLYQLNQIRMYPKETLYFIRLETYASAVQQLQNQKNLEKLVFYWTS